MAIKIRKLYGRSGNRRNHNKPNAQENQTGLYRDRRRGKAVLDRRKRTGELRTNNSDEHSSCGHTGGSVGNYALFAGGQDANTSVATVDTYNASLTKGTAPNLNESAWNSAAASVGNYVRFAGGQHDYYQSKVTAYNKSLTKSTPSALSSTKEGLSAAAVGSYALFAGGSRGSGTLKTVDCL